MTLSTCRTACGREGGDEGTGVVAVGGGAAVAVTSKATPLATELAHLMREDIPQACYVADGLGISICLTLGLLEPLVGHIF